MISREEFNTACDNYVGHDELVRMITNDFISHRDIEFARKQHYWLKLRHIEKDLYLKNLLLLGYYKEALEELNNICDKIFIQNPFLINTLIKLRFKLKLNVINSQHILILSQSIYSGQSNPLTKFGEDNLDKILKEIDSILISKYPNGFLEQFYDIIEEGEIKSTYNIKYYYKYFQLGTEAQKDLNKIKYRKDAKGNAPKSCVESAISHACTNLMREAENNVRISIGGKKIGEGYISETDLYYRIKKHFSYLEVIQHARPKFLGRQHFDIWLPEIRTAIEYHGTQHDEPVDFFGGKDAFEKNQERDELKRKKCKLNKVSLFEVRPDYNFEELIIEIEKKVNK
ncbi:hypothetical protein [Tamlana flava]|uniref:hypothetical protein n=1 Tax=Tamlana flava TaxID=3158572 RepID=UPI00351BD0F4